MQKKEQNGGQGKELQERDLVSWVWLTFEMLTNKEMSTHLESDNVNGE